MAGSGSAAEFHALTLPGADLDRIALLGLSFGGYLAPGCHVRAPAGGLRR